MEQEDNELLTLELIHRYVELLDKYFGSVSIIGIFILLIKFVHGSFVMYVLWAFLYYCHELKILAISENNVEYKLWLYTKLV